LKTTNGIQCTKAKTLKNYEMMQYLVRRKNMPVSVESPHATCQPRVHSSKSFFEEEKCYASKQLITGNCDKTN